MAQTASISFPSPLIGMFGIFATLSLIQVVSPEANDKVFAFFQPALDWLARWLPLYAPPAPRRTSHPRQLPASLRWSRTPSRGSC